MSRREENIARAQAGIAAFNRGDQAALMEFIHPEVEALVGPRLMNTGTWHGHEGYREMVGAWNEAWGEIQTRPVAVETPDDDHVIVEILQTATGSGSGVPVEMTVFYLLEIRDARAVRVHIYADRQAALEALRK
jgi:ketosteroid isomerase-like protein